MTKYTTNVTIDDDYYLCDINKPRALTEYRYAVNAYGTWGTGTLTFKISTDDGNTLVDLQDATGTPIALTANGNFTGNWGNGSKNNDAPKFYATMSGSTNATVTVDVFDNNG